MLLFSAFVAGSFAFGKSIADQIDPVVLTAARFLLAAVLLGAGLAMTGRVQRSHYRQPWRFFILGGLFVLYFVLMFHALRLTSSIATSTIFTTMPLAAALLDRAFFRRASPTLVWVALLIGAIGALWVVFEGSLSDMLSLAIGKGELLFFLGTLSHAVYAVLIPRLRRSEPIYATTLGVSTAAALILIIGYGPRLLATDWMGFSVTVWGVLIYLTVFTTLATFALITYAADRLTSARVTAYTYLTPFWVVLLDSALGRGWPAGIVLLGGIPIAIALWLLFLEPS